MNSKPTHVVCVESKAQDGKSYWPRIGSAFAIKNGLKITLYAAPIGKELFLFDALSAPADINPEQDTIQDV